MHRVAFPCQQRLHGRAVAVDHDGVRDNLVAAAQHREIAPHGFLGLQGFLFPVSQHVYGRGVEQLQGRDGLLSPVFLQRADQRVGDHHADEQHVSVAPDQEQADGQRDVQQVEPRKDMLQEDPSDGLLVPACHPVGKSVPAGFLRLFLS